jgi:hypothetical protein
MRTNKKANVPVERTPFVLDSFNKPYYIAIHKGGFGLSKCPAEAIRRAQESVQLKAKPTQLLIYRSFTEVKPTGFVAWPNGEQPILVGLTTTHRTWTPKRSLERLTSASIRKSFEWASD